MKIYLVGLSGVGKSSLGMQLSSLLDSPFIDLDQQIEKHSGNSITSLFKKEGEAHFRKVESEQLRLDQSMSSFVMATGGGTPCFFDNMEYMLNHGTVIYLTLSISQLASRLTDSYHRPLLRGDSTGELELKLENQLLDREKYYSKAHLHFDVENMNKEKMEALIEELNKTI